MANNAANLVEANLQFGNIINNAFVADSNAQISGANDGTVRIEAGLTHVLGPLTVQGAINAPGGITANVIGNAASATRLQTTRTISLGGNVVGSVEFDGTSNVSITSTVTHVRGVSFQTGNTNPSGTTRLNMHGYLYATRVYNAVWNDIADFIVVDSDTPIKYGSAYVIDDQEHVQPSSRYAQRGALGIASDTYGFGVGQKDDGSTQLPIAIGGFVLAHVDKVYPAGTALTTSSEGKLIRANILIRLAFPERILATFYKAEHNETWNGVAVQGRHWVKVK